MHCRGIPLYLEGKFAKKMVNLFGWRAHAVTRSQKNGGCPLLLGGLKIMIFGGWAAHHVIPQGTHNGGKPLHWSHLRPCYPYLEYNVV
jgi:hypothetical protein